MTNYETGIVQNESIFLLVDRLHKMGLGKLSDFNLPENGELGFKIEGGYLKLVNKGVDGEFTYLNIYDFGQFDLAILSADGFYKTEIKGEMGYLTFTVKEGTKTSSVMLTKDGLKLNNGPLITTGNGSPEGIVAAKVGSIYTRQDGGVGTTLYIKESGTGNTGWVSK